MLIKRDWFNNYIFAVITSLVSSHIMLDMVIHYSTTALRALSESFPMDTNMTGFKWFSKIFASLCFGLGFKMKLRETLAIRKP